MLQPLCAVCGRPVEARAEGGRAVRCGTCFDEYLRSIDARFLEHYAEFGARARQVLAETALRALVLANTGDRKLLGLSIYQQFVAAASDLIALLAALRGRATAPIARTLLEFRLDAEQARCFFADVARLSGAELLATLDLPLPERVPSGLPARTSKEVVRALRQALADLGRLNEFRDLGERALVQASEHFRAGAVPAASTGWLAGRELSAGQVASLALDLSRGRLDIAALRVDEQRLAQVVDGIDVFTRLTRNLIYAFVTLHDSTAVPLGLHDAQRVRVG